MMEQYDLGRGQFQPRSVDRVTLEHVRVQANKVIFRALSDEKFRMRLRANPEKVLDEAGLASGPAEDLLREMVIDGRSLAADCTITCLTTCWWTCIASLF